MIREDYISMTEIIIKPHEGIGDLRLGMTHEEILSTLENMSVSWNNGKKSTFNVDTDMPIGNQTVRRYSDRHSFFIVTYENDRAVEIGIDNPRPYHKLFVTLNDIPVFTVPAYDLIRMFRGSDTIECDYKDDFLLSTEYILKESGIRFWREHGFHPKEILDPKLTDCLSVSEDEEYPEDKYVLFQQLFEDCFFNIIAVRA